MTSEKWAGFTDEDIERINSSPEEKNSCSDETSEMEGLASKKRAQRKNRNLTDKSLSKESTGNDFREVNSVCSDKNIEENSAVEKNIAVSRNSYQDRRKYIHRTFIDKDHCACESCPPDGKERSISPTVNIQDPDVSNENLETYNEETNTNESSTNLPPLEIFEMRQKRIEEENARRRTLITKAINDKRLQTHAEAIKLAKITQELNRIDHNLSSDVSILRNYIERASIEFSEAEKRYLKAEKEYVESKLFLFEKMQRKEMLTEHLCAIIEQNENRKADKLIELMKQLEMEVVVNDCEMNGHEPILPNLCSLSDEPYHSCQTIKPNQPLSKDKVESQEMPLDIKTEEDTPANASSTINATPPVDKT